MKTPTHSTELPQFWEGLARAERSFAEEDRRRRRASVESITLHLEKARVYDAEARRLRAAQESTTNAAPVMPDRDVLADEVRETAAEAVRSCESCGGGVDAGDECHGCGRMICVRCVEVYGHQLGGRHDLMPQAGKFGVRT